MINLIGLSGYMGSGKSLVGEMIQYLAEYPKSLNKTDYGKNRSFNSFKMDIGMGHISEWEIKGFSVKLKEIASILIGIPAYKFENQDVKSSILPECWDYKKKMPRESLEQENIYYIDMKMSVRDLLQKLGTDAVRDNVHENAWVNALFADYIANVGEYDADATTLDRSFRMPKWIITDVRFPNEAQAIKAKGGIIVRINRPKYIGLDMYPVTIIPHPSETALDDWEFDYEIGNSGTIKELIEKTREMLKKYEIT